MFIVAAKAVAEQVTQENLATGPIYPPQSHIFDASLHVAVRLAEHIFEKKLAGIPRVTDVAAHIHACAFQPVYTSKM
jgi:malate dehydrogenase (oxaloacetate-decarboxylating)(NADP+)